MQVMVFQQGRQATNFEIKILEIDRKLLYTVWNEINSPTTGSTKYIFFCKMLKKKTSEYFLKFLFLFKISAYCITYIHTYITGHYKPSARNTN